MVPLLPSDILENPPSSKDGLSVQEQLQCRILGCRIISKASLLLGLPQQTICTAQTIFHRFYYRRSMKEFGVFSIAMVCTTLAAKVEETPRQIKVALRAFAKIFNQYQPAHHKESEIGSRLYMQWHHFLHTQETLVLKELGFSMYNIMDHPHKYILFFCDILSTQNQESDKRLAQSAWTYLNDSMYIDLCVRFPAKCIAAAAMHLAASRESQLLPESWWNLFSVPLEDIVVISTCIMALEKLTSLSQDTVSRVFQDIHDATNSGMKTDTSVARTTNSTDITNELATSTVKLETSAVTNSITVNNSNKLEGTQGSDRSIDRVGDASTSYESKQTIQYHDRNKRQSERYRSHSSSRRRRRRSRNSQRRRSTSRNNRRKRRRSKSRYSTSSARHKKPRNRSRSRSRINS